MNATVNGVNAPVRMAPLAGSSRTSALQTGVNASATQSKLANVSGGGRRRSRSRRSKRGGDTQPITVIKPSYPNTFIGPQDPSIQQHSNATSMNKAYVQSQGDNVPLVGAGPGRRSRRRSRTTRKSRKHRKSRKSRK